MQMNRISIIITLSQTFMDRLGMDLILHILQYVEHICSWCGIALSKKYIDLINCKYCLKLKKHLKIFTQKQRNPRNGGTRRTIRRYGGNMEINNIIMKIIISPMIQEDPEVMWLQTKYGHARFSKMLLTACNIARTGSTIENVLQIVIDIDNFLQKQNVVLYHNGVCHRNYCDQCGGYRRKYGTPLDARLLKEIYDEYS